MINDLLFVYGTLLIDDNQFALYLNGNSVLLGSGKIQGKLYDVGSYPALIIDRSGNYDVSGSICKLNDAAKALSVLDPYEGIGPDEGSPNLYERRLQPVNTANGEMLCWVYIYNQPVDGLKEITSGDYLAYLKTRQALGH
ncbi:gamma-glutamylcyclotransferase [Mucilaginibacter sp. UR6-11]|uniref:gamma-glutamylcyclotransferase family protein n=1 Tax=Mucilaginibacter sp. UR6-11 TaxID=1435644 RepID=UPI001E4B2CA1|nr:gamma-glutamylcyclotransferase family protein [Mucilaginibacter sp. UR6-11]MCC8426289.1 gamma-glutamylcyclotransferase [Mucilaginibacter sp. UR6-11]